ncbi:hypothetical protein L226DRAFT_213158 [Lentinus tigrinus ALCF2SS1-7]|uniref:uncharacterized protein n=1 Tax=Lentinus tigrinus ALCF2SS1-7 TaxID=1328758 RepID=UPI0011662D1B|nr:hypothetical protein L226DRAFT_213158 [Lentinus tigrinus ALCF2SS1-7]
MEAGSYMGWTVDSLARGSWQPSLGDCNSIVMKVDEQRDQTRYVPAVYMRAGRARGCVARALNHWRRRECTGADLRARASCEILRRALTWTFPRRVGSMFAAASHPSAQLEPYSTSTAAPSSPAAQPPRRSPRTPSSRSRYAGTVSALVVPPLLVLVDGASLSAVTGIHAPWPIS